MIGEYGLSIRATVEASARPLRLRQTFTPRVARVRNLHGRSCRMTNASISRELAFRESDGSGCGEELGRARERGQRVEASCAFDTGPSHDTLAIDEEVPDELCSVLGEYLLVNRGHREVVSGVEHRVGLQRVNGGR